LNNKNFENKHLEKIQNLKKFKNNFKVALIPIIMNINQSKQSKIKAIIFDRDGVLIDSEYAHLQSVELSLNKQNFSLKKEDEKEVVGMHPDEYTSYFVSKYKIDADKFKEYQYHFYLRMFQKAPLINDMIDLVKKLEGKYKLALTTSSNYETTENMIARAELDGVFDKIVTNEFYKRKNHFPTHI